MRDIILIVLQVIGLICLAFWVFFIIVWYVDWYFFTSKEDRKKIKAQSESLWGVSLNFKKQW